MAAVDPILYRMAQAACNARGEDAAVQLLFERHHLPLRPRVEPENPTPGKSHLERTIMSRYTVDHHSFTVSDMEKSLEFYRDLLGLEVIKNAVRKNLPAYDQIVGFADAHLHIVALQDEDESFKLELIQYINPPGVVAERDVHHVGISHLGLVVEDIHALYLRLLEAGVTFNCPPLEVVIAGRTEWSLYMFDPDRIPIELMQK